MGASHQTQLLIQSTAGGGSGDKFKKVKAWNLLNAYLESGEASS